MGWALVDDGFFSHPKVAQLMIDSRNGTGLQAAGLWVLALSWAYRHTRDKPPDYQGAIPDRMLEVWNRNWDGGVHEAAAALVQAELWDRVALGSCTHRIHDFRHWGQLDIRDAKRAGGRLGAERRWHTPELFDGIPIESKNGSSHSSKSGPIDGSNPESIASYSYSDSYSKPSQAKKERPADGPDFILFWAAYPRRDAKDAARKAWAKAVKRAEPAEIIAGARRYAERRARSIEADREDGPKFTAMASTWLNGGRWMDEPEPEPERGPAIREVGTFE